MFLKLVNFGLAVTFSGYGVLVGFAKGRPLFLLAGEALSLFQIPGTS